MRSVADEARCREVMRETGLGGCDWLAFRPSRRASREGHVSPGSSGHWQKNRSPRRGDWRPWERSGRVGRRGRPWTQEWGEPRARLGRGVESAFGMSVGEALMTVRSWRETAERHCARQPRSIACFRQETPKEPGRWPGGEHFRHTRNTSGAAAATRWLHGEPRPVQGEEADAAR